MLLHCYAANSTEKQTAAEQRSAMFSSSRLRIFLSSLVRTIRTNNSWEAGTCCVSAWLQCNELVESLAGRTELQFCKRSKVGPGMLYIGAWICHLQQVGRPENHMNPDLPHFFYNISGQAHLLKGVFKDLLAKSGKLNCLDDAGYSAPDLKTGADSWMWDVIHSTICSTLTK